MLLRNASSRSSRLAMMSHRAPTHARVPQTPRGFRRPSPPSPEWLPMPPITCLPHTMETPRLPPKMRASPSLGLDMVRNMAQDFSAE